MKNIGLMVLAFTGGARVAWAGGAVNGGTPFESVTFLGSANLIAGELVDEDGATVASGGVGFVARAGERWTFLGTFTFGSSGTGKDDASARDYVEFLRVPTAALGVDLHLRWLTSCDKIWFGWSVGFRGSHQAFGYGDGDQENINAIAVDPSAALSVPLDVGKEIYFVAEAGLSARFWNRPDQAFVDALALEGREHTYFGVRGLAAMNIGNIHVGIELTRMWGGRLDALEEFAIVPYVGLRGRLGATEPARGAVDALPPPATPLL